MSRVYLITYDLRKPGQDYSALYEAIKQLGDWQHPMESVWAVKTSFFTENDIYSQLRKMIDDNDYLFIVEITRQKYQGWLAKSFWTWLNE